MGLFDMFSGNGNGNGYMPQVGTFLTERQLPTGSTIGQGRGGYSQAASMPWALKQFRSPTSLTGAGTISAAIPGMAQNMVNAQQLGPQQRFYDAITYQGDELARDREATQMARIASNNAQTNWAYNFGQAQNLFSLFNQLLG